MEMRELIESITRELIKNMPIDKLAPPKVLYIFCDSTAHEPFYEHFIKLSNHGICHDILFLDGETSSWLGIHHIECGGAGKVIATDEYAPAPIELPKEYDGIVIPEIDLDNAARVVTGMKGTIKAEIIFSALLLEKFVIIGEDIPGLKRSDRRCLRTLSLTAPYHKLFLKQIEEMKELGIEFRPQKDLADAVIQRLKGKKQAQPMGGEAESVQEEPIFFSGKLLTSDWIMSQSRFPNQQISIRRGTIISPLAQDLLREMGITVQYIAKG
jgi:hypothetical protein